MKQVFSNGNLQTNQTQINFNYAPYQSDFFSKNTPLNCETLNASAKLKIMCMNF